MAHNGTDGQNPQETEEKRELPDKETVQKNIREITDFQNRITRHKSASFSDTDKKIIKDIFSKEEKKTEIQKQLNGLLTLEGFPEMHANESYEETMAVFTWMKEHADAIELLNNDEMLRFLDNKEYLEAARKTIWLRDELKHWFGVYEEDIKGPLTAIAEQEKEAKDLKKIDDNKDLSEPDKEKQKNELKEKNEKARKERATKNEKRKAPCREELNNYKEYNKLGQFAEKLSEAGNSHDKEDYRTLKSMLQHVSHGYSFADMYPEYKNNLAALSDAQKKALPYFHIKEQINKYLDHKAKDGINTKDLKKLAAVEELNQYVSERIRELDPASFELGKKSFKKEDVRGSYQEEYEAEAAGSNGLCNTSTDGAVYEAKANAYNNMHKGKSFIDAEVLKNASSCLDRIMLKVQKNNLDKIPGNLEAKDREVFINKKVLKDFTKLKSKLVEAPITTKKAPSKVKEEPSIGPLIQ